MTLKIYPEGYKQPDHTAIDRAAEQVRAFGEAARWLFIHSPGDWNHGLDYEQAEQAYQLAWGEYKLGTAIKPNPDAVTAAAIALVWEWRRADDGSEEE